MSRSELGEASQVSRLPLSDYPSSNVKILTMIDAGIKISNSCS